ncbi:MAG: extracellular solute-binding protein [Oscillospiraceae bacterium]|nr:extracellular solute-binding protein [Oscillospiraceae bacterium]
MLRTKKILAGVLAVAAALSITACDSEPVSTPNGNSGVNSNGTPNAPSTSSTTPATTIDPDELAATDAENKDVNSDFFTPDGNSGKIVWLGYYDLMTDGSASEQYKVFTSDVYGGEIEYVSSPSNEGYFEKLGTLIASDDSPDIVRYEWLSYPMGMSKNMYESVDGLIDFTTPLWSDMSDIIEDFAYKGKHYYLPYRITTNFALNYNRRAVVDAGLTDPYDLYLTNNWTWDTFRELLIEWCNLDDQNIGYCGTGGMSFIATTGTPLIDVQADGTILNNVSNANITRAMEFCSGLYRDGLTYQKELGDWVDPTLWAKNSEQILFLGMNPEWTYSAAAGAIQNPTGVENDICNTPSDFAFVPFPRDPSADEYCIAYDSFGYMIPKGAKNIKGAVDWIQLNRVFQTDEALHATAREDAINPEPVYYTAGKYEGMQKWALVWDERVYDVWQDMMDPTKFSYVFDDCYGFNAELTTIADTVLDTPLFDGASFSQISAENAPLMDAIIDEYR